MIVVDDVISTGGTLQATLDSLELAGAEVMDTVIVVERGNGAELLRSKGYNLKTMVRVKVEGGRVSEVEPGISK